MSMIKCIQNLIKFRPSILKILSKNQFQTSIKGYNSASLGPIWPKFKLCPDLLGVLVTWKNEEDPIKNVGARVFTTLYINFSDVQGHITLELVVVSAEIWTHSSFHACPLYLQEWGRSNQNEGARVFTRFVHYTSLGIFQTLKGS